MSWTRNSMEKDDDGWYDDEDDIKEQRENEFVVQNNFEATKGNEMKRICPSCKGKGHVLNKSLVLFVPVVSWVIAWLEKDDKESVTREECKRCNGKGYQIF